MPNGRPLAGRHAVKLVRAQFRPTAVKTYNRQIEFQLIPKTLNPHKRREFANQGDFVFRKGNKVNEKVKHGAAELVIFYFIEVDNEKRVRLLFVRFLQQIFQTLDRHTRRCESINSNPVIFPGKRRLKELICVGTADKDRVKTVFRLLIETRDRMKRPVISGIKHRLNTAKHQHGECREKQDFQQFLHCAHRLIHLFQ